MKTNLIKCDIPIIWLDTSIIIKIVKWKNNSLKNKSDLKTIPEIYKTIRKLVDSRKIICPIADQREEIYWNDNLTLEVLSSLSKGIKFKFRLSIEKYQIQQFMKAYLEEPSEVIISYNHAFKRDPIKELMEEKKYVILVNMPKLESVHDIEQKKENLKNQIEDIRINAQKRKEKFEQRLGLEYEGCLNAILKLGSNSLKKITIQKDFSLENCDNLLALAEPLSWWKHFNGEPNGLKGLIKFYLSDVFKEIPIIEIKCKVLAKILTESTGVNVGDVMDIDQISAVLPYCNYLVVDRAMKHWLLKLNLDKKYKTNIFSMSNYASLLEILNKT